MEAMSKKLQGLDKRSVRCGDYVQKNKKLGYNKSGWWGICPNHKNVWTQEKVRRSIMSKAEKILDITS